MTTDAAIHVRGLEKSYKKLEVLRGVDFDVPRGSIFALLVRSEQRGLVDVEKVPSDKGPPRKVYSLNAQGQAYLEEFWRTWSFLTERLEQLHEGGK